LICLYCKTQLINDVSIIYDDYRIFEEKNKNYYRINLRVNYIISRLNVIHTIAVDMKNATNHINPIIKQFDIETAKVEKISQAGFVTAVFWRLNF